MTITEVIKTYGIPKSTVYRYVREGKLKVIKNPIGNGMVIPPEEEPTLQALATIYRLKSRKGGEER